tara:strand:+ start:2543 stop:3556 length:1014 start_codon:yes stop_codon:yes gene_type:complete
MKATVSSVLASSISAAVRAASSISVQALNVVIERAQVSTAITAGYAISTVSRVIPETQVGYILAAASAFTDNEQWWKRYQDAVAITELAAISISKPLADQAVISESKAIGFDKPLDDSIEVTESLIITLIFIREVFDTVSATDELKSVDVSKALVDSIFATEQKNFSFSKSLSDTASIAELKRISFSKPVSDTVSMSESSRASLAKATTDSVTTSESSARSVSKNLTDTTAITEAKSFVLQKALSDTTLISEALSKIVDYNRLFADSATMSDQQSLALSVLITDIMSLTDSQSMLYEKSITGDVVTPVDSIVSIVITSGATQLMNSFPLNYFTLNGP